MDPDQFVKARQFTKTAYRDVYPAIDPTAASNNQAGKVIVITGASKGIGREGFVKSFAKSGPKGIVLVARSADSLEAVSNEIHAINKEIKVLAVPTDLLNAKSVAALWEKVKETFGHADVLINNAGTIVGGTITDTDVDAWWSDFEINIRGTFIVTQGFLRLLGKDRKATVVNVTSAAALLVFPGMSSYALSKLVTAQFSAFITAENTNATAISLNPGTVLTDMTQPAFAPFAKDTPALAGGIGVWLSTEKAAFLNGKYVESNWSVDELVARKEEIVSQGKLKIDLVGELGQEQFQKQ